ncbi:hypothetical protein NDU88_002992 [Pleurodeles waltl]|uniref:Uncharacterized protein n=1 Tax=Pleurodeles waltl TaxID=8319 RepID=A0AAV7NGZ6_PLEWA|nr:hypothetical protein NDU88_002992 [Pleurodeles waltl]
MLSDGPRKRQRGLVGAVCIHDTGRGSGSGRPLRRSSLDPQAGVGSPVPRGMSQGLKLVQLSLSWRTRDESMGPGVPAGAGQRRPWAIPGLTPVFLALSVSPRVQAPGSSGPLPPVAPPLSFPFQRRCASVLHIFGGRGGSG